MSREGNPGTGKIAVVPHVVYGQRHELPLSYDLYRPAEANGAAVLFINSGGFASGQLIQHAEAGQSGHRFLEPQELTVQGAPPPIPLLAQFSFAGLLAKGFTVFDVRHSNHPPAMLDGMVEDVHNAAGHIREHAADYGLDAARLGVWGASAGVYLALHLGLAFRDAAFAAIATYYPAGYDFVADLDRFPDLAKALPMLGIARSELDALGLKHHVHRDAPPVLIVYGVDDMPFITEPCRALCQELQRSSGGIRCVAIPGTGHEFRGEDGYHEEHGARAYTEMVEWFEMYLCDEPFRPGRVTTDTR
ncbi:alpha/beta hydrolase fold domain-containing protein [Candidatus Bipolaricaulota bacterium]|nr:alpha/beta hydrolase fold domain-containing protein [Candidatus Bipolaricaulota bacterium]